jgi:hypothetical protein
VRQLLIFRRHETTGQLLDIRDMLFHTLIDGGTGSGKTNAILYMLDLLALGDVFPYLLAGVAAMAAVGAFALTTRSLEILQVGPEPDVPT